MSTKFETVKKWYRMGLWSADRVKNAVVKGWITSDEYKSITGEAYSE